jgi:aminoglycoside 6-adenylyltransferase
VDYDNAIRSLTAWAHSSGNVRAMVMTGSGAAGEPHPLSDRDIEIYARDPAPLLADDSWWDRLGDVLVVERLADPNWHPSRLVYYVGGKLDLTVIRADVLPTMSHERPITVLVDKDGLTDSLNMKVAGPSLPDEAAFQEQLNWGYAAALMCAKAIVRDEPWSSKIRDKGPESITADRHRVGPSCALRTRLRRAFPGLRHAEMDGCRPAAGA